MKKSDAPAFFLVIDLEATCDEGHAIPGEETEIIEIGAVLVNGSSLAPVAEHQTFIRPLRHPKLTPFCTELTKITQADVDGAPLFPEAMRALSRFIDRRDALFCSWGEYDRNQFKRDAKRHGVALPFGGRHLNLKKSFSAELREERLYGMDGALRRVGLDLVGTHHRGIDDARNIARLLPYCLGWREAPRFSARSG
jgi:3'-5' exoribonuclease 1